MNARVLTTELLDSLPATDPAAIQSRRDLRRVNVWMGNPRHIAGALQNVSPPRTLLDLGGGDGTFLLALARRLPATWRGVNAAVVDRQNLLEPATCADLN